MGANFDDSTWGIEKTLTFEGGYDAFNSKTGDPETMMGMTRDDKIRWDIVDKYKQITTDFSEFGELYSLCKGNGEFMFSVISAYKSAYWDMCKCDEIIDQRVAFNIFDFAVNAGVHKAVIIAQGILGVQRDGLIGNITLNALNLYAADSFIGKYKIERKAFYHNLVTLKPHKAVYLTGWLDRVDKC